MMDNTLYVDSFLNEGLSVQTLSGAILAESGVRIMSAYFDGPAALRANVRVGPNVRAGRYLAMNRDAFISNAIIGNFCTIGARSSINPYNHPIDWLSVHEFQYHKRAFDFVTEYNDFARLPYEEAPGSSMRGHIGNDVWTGHNSNILSGSSVGNGAIIAAGAIVTADVPAYAIVAGVPAKVIRFRFAGNVIDRLESVRWWDMPLSLLSGLPFNDIERCLDQLEAIRSRLDQ